MMNEYVAVLNRRSLRWSKLLQESPHIEKNLTGDGSRTQPLRFVFIFVFMQINQSFSK